MKRNLKKVFGIVTTTAMAASMFAMPAAADETKEGSSITYPLETDIESVSWYAQEGIVPHEKFRMHPNLHSILVWLSIWV